MKRITSLLLIVCMTLISLCACAKDGEMKPQDSEPTLDAAALEKMNAAEILCAYFSAAVKAYPGENTEKIASRIALYEFFDNIEWNIYTQEWGSENAVFLSDFPEDFTLTQCVRVSVISSFLSPESTLSGYIFELKEGEDAAQLCELLKQNVVLPQDNNQIGFETAVEGNYVFLAICDNRLKDSLGSDPDRKDSANYLLRKLRLCADMNAPVRTINATDETGFYNTGVKSTDLIEKDAALAEPMVGYGFSVVLVKVKDAKDAQTVAQEMEGGLNPMKWVCTGAESVKVTVCGQYVLGIMSSTEDCERISAAFLQMLA